MAEILNPAETNEGTAGTVPAPDDDAGSGSEGGAEDETNDAEFTDTAEDTPADDKGQSDKPSGTKDEKTQTKEQNSENARRRREAERQRDLQAAREQAIIETLNGKNPYTGEPVKDSMDVKEYLLMREIEKKGGDPVADYSKFSKEKERAEAAEKVRKQESDVWFAKDRDAFRAKYPDVNIDDLILDQKFEIFAKGKVGVIPLSEIYDGYRSMVDEFEKKSKRIAKQMVANKKSSPGALSGSGSPSGGFFTRDQVSKMSREEVSKNYDKIRESMTKWN